MIVPLDQGGNPPETPERRPVQLPDGVHYRSVVRVQHVAAVVAVAGQVELTDASKTGIPQGTRPGSRSRGCARLTSDVVQVEEDAAVASRRDPRPGTPNSLMVDEAYST